MNSYLMIETTKQLNRANPEKSHWFLPKPWRPGPYFDPNWDYDYRAHYPELRPHVQIPIDQPARVSLGTTKEGYYYYDEDWKPYRMPYLKGTLYEIRLSLDRRTISIIQIQLVRGSALSFVFCKSLYIGNLGGVPSHLRVAEGVHFARLRQEQAQDRAQDQAQD